MERMSTAQANSILHGSKNNVARSLLGRISCCTDVTSELPAIHNDIESANAEKTVTADEYQALTRLCNDVVIHINAIRYDGGESVKQSFVSILKNRIWACTELAKVLQLRNSVTEMLMLEFVNLEEYIALSNEVDRYIQYTLSNGGMR